MESVVDGNGGGNPLVMSQLSHIKELVKQLDVHLRGCPDLCKHLAAQIFTVTERSIGMMRSGHFHGRKRSAADAGLETQPSPLSGVSNTSFMAKRKRKMMEKGKHQVRLSSAGGGGGAETLDDGFSWRKYGQKDILGAQHPRGYYRCTHQKSQGCAATKQMQRVDEDPTLYDVTYHGTHTCIHKAVAAGKVQPATPNPEARSLLKNLSSSLTVDTEGLTSGPLLSTPYSFSWPAVTSLTPPGQYPSSTLSTPENYFAQGLSLSRSEHELSASPATSDFSYIPINPFEEEWRAQSELTEMIAATSMPEAAIEETAFSLDGFELVELFDPGNHKCSYPNFDVSIFLA